jgi:hypothetical protein
MQGITNLWKTTTGKLTIIGGGGVAGLLSICFVCTVCSAFVGSNENTQEAVSRPTQTPIESLAIETPPTAPPPEKLLELQPTEVLIEPTSAETLTALLPTETSVVEVLLTETPTPAILKPIVTASENEINLRNGPGTDYEVVGTLPAGESLEIVGRNTNSSWWQVSTQTGLAWVAAEVVAANNIDDSIPIVEAPPPPVQPLPVEQSPQPTSAPTSVPVAPAQPVFTGETVDPPWWPCAEGQIKGNRDSGKYHVPSGQFYDKTYEGVECFNTETEAEAAGYIRSQR